MFNVDVIIEKQTNKKHEHKDDLCLHECIFNKCL